LGAAFFGGALAVALAVVLALGVVLFLLATVDLAVAEAFLRVVVLAFATGFFAVAVLVLAGAFFRVVVLGLAAGFLAAVVVFFVWVFAFDRAGVCFLVALWVSFARASSGLAVDSCLVVDLIKLSFPMKNPFKIQ